MAPLLPEQTGMAWTAEARRTKKRRGQSKFFMYNIVHSNDI